MSLVHKTGIAGAVTGMLIAVLGGILGEVHILQILLRVLINAVVGGLLLVLALSAIRKFLPELLPEGDAAPADPDAMAGQATGSAVDITLEGDEDQGAAGDQAAALRAMRSRQDSVGEGGGDDDSLIEEVSDEPAGSAAPLAEAEGFSEEAFYNNIDQLPDIGGFSDNFGGEDDGAGATSVVDADMVAADSGGSRGSGGGKGGMDPKLMAQAISTALKKGS